VAEVEFRDGSKMLPDYLSDLMVGLDTYRLTYEEAVAEANRRLERRHIDSAMGAVMRQHLKPDEVLR